VKEGVLDDLALQMTWAETPWDSALFGFPVLHIDHLECRGDRVAAQRAFVAFERHRDAIGCRFASCRVPADHMAESLLLQDRGFRVVEMLFHPELDLRTASSPAPASPLELAPASAASLPALLDIAGAGFGHERLHVDPRVPRGLGDQRYRNWVRAALDHPRQRLVELREGGSVVAFFVTERLDDGTCYWHLNAVAPAAQGRGIGARAWSTMIESARREGATRVRSAITARNVRVMNLYARLGFRFLPPLVGLHWAAP
jgi:GNAT superfamily N-acetyltransferase